MNYLDCAAAELILLCDMPKEAQQKLLRPINCSEELWQKIRISLDSKLKWRLYLIQKE